VGVLLQPGGNPKRPVADRPVLAMLQQDLAPSTIGVVYAFLAGIFRAAVRDRLIVASPCVGIRLPKPEPKRVEPLATEKVEALIDALAAHLAAFPAARVEVLDATRKPNPKRRPAALVFTGATGRPLRRTRFSGVWRPAAAAGRATG
jgi:hypothetical protein